MHRFFLCTILCALVVLTTNKSICHASAKTIEETTHIEQLSAFLEQHAPLDENIILVDGNTSNIKETRNETELSGTDHDNRNSQNDNKEDIVNAAHVAELVRRKRRTTDILVACFFFVAAVWLLMATAYSVVLLVLLRLQARGELDIYDENLGRISLCSDRIRLNFGWILRRYAVQLEEVSIIQCIRFWADENVQYFALIRIKFTLLNLVRFSS